MKAFRRLTLATPILLLLFVPYTHLLTTQKLFSSLKYTYIGSNMQGQLSSISQVSRQNLFYSSLSWQRQIISAHFVVNYNISGSNAVSDEYAQTASDSLENSWTTEVDDYGFSQPPNFPIAVYTMDILTTKGLWGATAGSYSSLAGYRVENITLDKSMNTPLLQYVSAHEFFHAIQLSYNITAKWFIEDTTDWVVEGTAVWMGARVYPEYTGVDSYVQYANQYLSDPDRTVTQLSYDSVLFWIFLDEHHGGTDTIRNIMQQNENLNSIAAINATLTARGTTFTNVFKEWTIANYLKNSYYTKGHLFNSIHSFSFTYSGERWPLGTDVADWGSDYYEVSSSIIFMPINFTGNSHHNLTRILIEHATPLISDFVLSIPYAGSYWLMQANNLDKIVIIVRSLGTETSNDRTAYTLTWLSSSQTLNGPYTIASAPSNLYAKSDRGSQASSSVTAYTIGSSSSQNSEQTNTAIVTNSSYKSSATKKVCATNSSSQQNSAATSIYTLNNTSSQNSSAKLATVVNNSSFQSSSETASITVKLRADVNGDGVVDILDAAAVSAHWYPGPPVGPLGYDANFDINDDGGINVLDAALVSAYWTGPPKGPLAP